MDPTYQSGFYAPGRGTALHPELWDGCVGAWNPGLGNTGLSLRDWSGNQNNGVLTNGPTWENSGGRQALSFDGVDDRVQTQSATRPAFCTLSVWAYINYAGSDTFARVIEHGINNSITLCLNKTNNPLEIVLQVGDANTSISAIIDFDQLIHITATVTGNGGATQLFVNGALRSSFASSTSSSTVAKWFIGGEETAPTLTSISGLIDDVRIYSRVLSPNEIRLLAQRPGIAYELAPRKFYSLPAAAASSRQYRLFRPSILRGA